jgi:rhodanese-related sulfurtransferase
MGAMKKSYISILGIIVIVSLTILIVISVRSWNDYAFSSSAESTHATLISDNHFVAPDDAQKMIAATVKSVIFIDVRNPREFDNFHLDGARNIPLPQVLDNEYKSFWEDSNTKVLYGNDTHQADQVRTLLIQYGYTNISVLHGGANYWQQNILNAGPFSSKAEYDDEKLNAEALKAATGK